MGRQVVSGDADDHGILTLEGFIVVSEAFRFQRASGGIVSWIKIENHFFTFVVTERMVLVIRALEGKIRGFFM
jgi:hypothetical protein